MQVTGTGGSQVVPAKLAIPPRRPEVVVRERVVGLLDEAVEQPLTVVHAAAGYGKTTALATWLDTLDACRTWMSLDLLDNDPRRLLAHLLAAIDDSLPESMAEARKALGDGSDLLYTVVPLTVNALDDHASDRVVVVLDNYDVVRNPDCHELLLALVDALPEPVRLIVSSRTAPPLRLARRRMLEILGELGASELRFQDGESERLLNGSLELGLEPDVVDMIESRVEGWAAGLALLGSSLAEDSDRVNYLHAFATHKPELTGTKVATYLMEEVLDGTQPRLREFLCRTSILGRLNGPLCEAVLEDSTAHELLADVHRSNLFVAVLEADEAGEWLRYHRMFAELLERELNASSPGLVPVLHRRACAWFAANGLPEDAIRHAIAAGDGPRAATLLRENWRFLLNEQRFVTVRHLISELPPDRGDLDVFCEALDTLCMSLDGTDPRLVAQRLDALERRCDAPGAAPLIARMRVSPYFGDVKRAVEAGWAVWERYPDLDTRAQVASQLGAVLWFAGERAAARDVLEPIVPMIEDATLRGSALAVLALTAADEDDVALAERYAREAVGWAEAHGHGDALACHLAYLALGEALRLRGALDQADEQLVVAARTTARLPTSVYHASTLVFEAQLALSRRDLAQARARAAAARAIVDRYADVGTLAERLERVDATLQRRSDDELRGSQPTGAELRVLRLLPSDLTLAQIAEELFLSVHTVKSHVRRLYRRLGATTREQAIDAARARELI